VSHEAIEAQASLNQLMDLQSAAFLVSIGRLNELHGIALVHKAFQPERN